MTRKEAYRLIDLERENQEKLWPRNDEDVKSQQYFWYAPHILVLEECVDKLRKEWYGSSEEALQERIVKIAATAVRALEEVKN